MESSLHCNFHGKSFPRGGFRLLSLDLLRRLAFLAKMKIVLNKLPSKLDPKSSALVTALPAPHLLKILILKFHIIFLNDASGYIYLYGCMHISHFRVIGSVKMLNMQI